MVEPVHAHLQMPHDPRQLLAVSYLGLLSPISSWTRSRRPRANSRNWWASRGSSRAVDCFTYSSTESRNSASWRASRSRPRSGNAIHATGLADLAARR